MYTYNIMYLYNRIYTWNPLINQKLRPTSREHFLRSSFRYVGNRRVPETGTARTEAGHGHCVKGRCPVYASNTGSTRQWFNVATCFFFRAVTLESQGVANELQKITTPGNGVKTILEEETSVYTTPTLPEVVSNSIFTVRQCKESGFQ